MDILTDTQLLALAFCAVLAFIAYRTKQPAISLVAGAALFVLGFDIYQASQDLLILGLFLMTAIVQFVLCLPSRRR